ncbi:hypothetical protein M3Y94_00835900 [Aphelenchoides besseyi]|nr:hypothetical protein M3Y94_00835900 [Aphelenchoides besseyi]KAI6226970.1 hypothetical protein M3Y95_00677400 [Aphelenchoides besseyi]
MTQEVAVKANFFRRATTRIVDYVKNVRDDYVDVGRNLITDTKARPIKSTVIFGLLGGAAYALKTNPTETELYNRLRALRQQMVLTPSTIHSFNSDRKLAEITDLINTARLDYYDCWFFSLLVKRDWDRNVFSPASQDSNLKQWPWQTFSRNIIDIGAFHQFFLLEKAFLNYDVREEEFEEQSTAVS